jgi:hypothetical protein
VAALGVARINNVWIRAENLPVVHMAESPVLVSIVFQCLKRARRVVCVLGDARKIRVQYSYVEEVGHRRRIQDRTERAYDPRRQRGVSVFREEVRRFSVGDRIQFTAPANDLKIANRELGVITGIDEAGQLSLHMDSGRSLQIDPNKHPHLDYGYAMTGHSSQGQTANRVLIHVDTELAARDLLNSRMAYVSVSRGALDPQLFTNDREKLPTALGHDISKQSAEVPQINAPQHPRPPGSTCRAKRRNFFRQERGPR